MGSMNQDLDATDLIRDLDRDWAHSMGPHGSPLFPDCRGREKVLKGKGEGRRGEGGGGKSEVVVVVP
jgi:hypothetical protein